MTYLLWQIFACLLATAVLFFLLGWALRAWWRHKTAADNLITESERTSWQTSLEGMKSRLEAETSRQLAAEKALADAQLKPREVEEVVLVGGTTRTPLIRRTVQEYFDRKPHTELNPDEVVALGFVGRGCIGGQ